MTISYPLSIPNEAHIARMTWKPRSAVAVSESPFTLSQQVYAHQGDGWQVEVDLIPMERANAEAWFAFFLALNGREGTFLLGDPKGKTARGTWSSGSPVLNGSHAAGLRIINVRGIDGKTWAAGDWLQIGSGSSAYLHKVTQAGSQVGSPSSVEIDIWPRLRAAYTDGQAITLASAKGRFRLSSNEMPVSVEQVTYGFSFSAQEAL